MTEYVLASVEFSAKTITVYEEPNPKLKELEERARKIRELEQMVEKLQQDLASIRYQVENEITDLMFK